MKCEEEKLKDLLESEGLSSQQKELLVGWTNHLKTFRTDGQILDYAYCIREFGLYIKKPYQYALPSDIIGYSQFKSDLKESVTGNRISPISSISLRVYRQRINSFYRWVLSHTAYEINKELAYPLKTLVTRQEISPEQACKNRIDALLNNSLKDNANLGEQNLMNLRGYYNYKITSGKVESHRGFVSKLYYLKRLGIYLHHIGKVYKGATREDIQSFLAEVQKSILGKKKGVDKVIINTSYKAHLLDYYRFIYGMFDEEQPRKYPQVVAWLYQKRKKSHDKIPKEILSDNEIKSMIDKSGEQRDKALLALMGDCSARVGEIISINIEDIKVNEIQTQEAKYTHTIATVTLRGKTGERTNQLFNSVSHIRLWLLNHPLKDNPKAPMFVATKENRYGQRLSPVGINKILQRNARKAEMKKHVHAHLFRHSNITKMARLLSESELKIHAGWGAGSNMAMVYVHLSEKDVASKILQKYGLVTDNGLEEKSPLEAQICQNTICSYQNPSDAKFCLKCGYPLSLKTAVAMTKIKQQEEELHKEIFKREFTNKPTTANIKEAMYQILKTDPELITKLQQIAALAKEVEQ